MTGFLLAAIAMTLAAVALVAVPLLRDSAGRAPIAGVVAAIAIPAAATLLYALTSSYPWTAGGPGGTQVRADSADIAALRERVAAQPDDAAAWARLGEVYVAEERYAEARDAFREALQRDPQAGDELRLSYAEALVMVNRNALAREAGEIVDEVLSRDPVNAKALWYGGIAAFERGDTASARSRWSKLLEMSPPPQVRQIIEQQLAQLDAAVDGTANGGAAPAALAGTGTRIAVRVSLKPELAAQVRPGAALFLFARAPGAAGPPLAVVRRDAPALPLDIEISDADSMVPGRSMSGLPSVLITARLANDGEALQAPGDVFGEATWNPGQGAGAPLQILMDQVVR